MQTGQAAFVIKGSMYQNVGSVWAFAHHAAAGRMGHTSRGVPAGIPFGGHREYW